MSGVTAGETALKLDKITKLQCMKPINDILGGTHTGGDMETSTAPAKIAWEKHYSDGSGVEYAVRLDTTKSNMVDGGPVVEFEHVGSVEFPITQLDWLIACLMRIKAEVPPNTGIQPPATPVG